MEAASRRRHVKDLFVITKITKITKITISG